MTMFRAGVKGGALQQLGHRAVLSRGDARRLLCDLRRRLGHESEADECASVVRAGVVPYKQGHGPTLVATLLIYASRRQSQAAAGGPARALTSIASVGHLVAVFGSVSETFVTARVAAMRGPAGCRFWLDAAGGSVPLALPDGWTTDVDPMRMLDPNGEVRLQAGDLVRLSDPQAVSVETVEVVERRVSPRLGGARTRPMDSDGRPHTFLTDVQRALRCWAAAPALPVLVALFAVAAALPAFEAPRPRGCVPANACTSGSPVGYFVANVIVLPILIFGLGFLGAQRVWYADLYAGRRPYISWALGLSGRYVGRFLRLGLLLLVVLLPISFIAGRAGTVQAALLTLALTALIDIALTFVTPALTFTTHSAAKAIGIGLRELRRGWPSDLPYLLVPPLAVSLTCRAVPSATGSTTGLLIQTGAALLTSLFAGATTFRYLRQTESAPAIPGQPQT